MLDDDALAAGIEAAYAQALKSFDEGGVPVGSSLMVDGKVVAVGHNRRFQRGSNVLHGETDCIENAGHGVDFTRAVLFTTLSPCQMCAGTVLLFRIPTLVVLDNENVGDFRTSEDLLRAEGVDVLVRPHQPSIDLNRRFQTEYRARWMGDVGR